MPIRPLRPLISLGIGRMQSDLSIVCFVRAEEETRKKIRSMRSGNQTIRGDDELRGCDLPCLWIPMALKGLLSLVHAFNSSLVRESVTVAAVPKFAIPVVNMNILKRGRGRSRGGSSIAPHHRGSHNSHSPGKTLTPSLRAFLGCGGRSGRGGADSWAMYAPEQHMRPSPSVR